MQCSTLSGIMMNGGAVELLTANGQLIATLGLANPAAKAAAGGELEFNRIAEGDAIMAGTAATARIVSSDGAEISYAMSAPKIPAP